MKRRLVYVLLVLVAVAALVAASFAFLGSPKSSGGSGAKTHTMPGGTMPGMDMP